MIKVFPFIFILLWSSAFITTKPIIDYSDPFAALAFRFALVAFGFLIFSYWVFAVPEKIKSLAALLYGLAVDLFFSNVIGFNMLFFVATSYIIHLYVFRFRIFSYFQLSVFFSGSSTFYIACKYLLLSPINYSYLVLILSFAVNAILWIGVYLTMRAFRRRIF